MKGECTKISCLSRKDLDLSSVVIFRVQMRDISWLPIYYIDSEEYVGGSKQGVGIIYKFTSFIPLYFVLATFSFLDIKQAYYLQLLSN